MANKQKKYYNEGRLSYYIYKSKFNRDTIARSVLKMSYNTFQKAMKDPRKHLSIEQIERLSAAIEMPFYDILETIRYKNRINFSENLQ